MASGAAADVEDGQAANLAEKLVDARLLQGQQRIAVGVVARGPKIVAVARRKDQALGVVGDWRFLFHLFVALSKPNQIIHGKAPNRDFSAPKLSAIDRWPSQRPIARPQSESARAA